MCTLIKCAGRKRCLSKQEGDIAAAPHVLNADGYWCFDTSAQPRAKYETRVKRSENYKTCPEVKTQRKLGDMWSSELEWKLFWAARLLMRC